MRKPETRTEEGHGCCEQESTFSKAERVRSRISTTCFTQNATNESESAKRRESRKSYLHQPSADASVETETKPHSKKYPDRSQSLTNLPKCLYGQQKAALIMRRKRGQINCKDTYLSRSIGPSAFPQGTQIHENSTHDFMQQPLDFHVFHRSQCL